LLAVALLIGLASQPARAEQAPGAEATTGVTIEKKEQRVIVQPKPEAEAAAADAEAATRTLERQRRLEELIEEPMQPPRRPDLDESVVGGIQSRGIQSVKPKK
jgi:hypothetical protein